MLRSVPRAGQLALPGRRAAAGDAGGLGGRKGGPEPRGTPRLGLQYHLLDLLTMLVQLESLVGCVPPQYLNFKFSSKLYLVVCTMRM